jgi:hypothetical protein
VGRVAVAKALLSAGGARWAGFRVVRRGAKGKVGERFEILCGTERERDLALPQLAESAARHGWRAVRAHAYLSRPARKTDKVNSGKSLSSVNPYHLLRTQPPRNNKKRKQKAKAAPSGLVVAGFNPHSLGSDPTKVVALEEVLSKLRVDILGVSEVGPRPPPMQGYRWLSHPDSVVGFYVAIFLVPFVSVVKPVHERMLWLKVKHGKGFKQQLSVCTGYLPQANSAKAQVVEAWESLSKQVKEHAVGGEWVLVGDLNARIGRHLANGSGMGPQAATKTKAAVGQLGELVSNVAGEQLVELLVEHGAFSLQARRGLGDGGFEFTRLDPGSGAKTILDYVVVSAGLFKPMREHGVDYTDLGSDHFLAWAELGLATEMPVKQVRKEAWKLNVLRQKSREDQGWREAKQQLDVAMEAAMLGYDPVTLANGGSDQAAAGRVIGDLLRRFNEAGMKAVGKKRVSSRFSRPWVDEELKAKVKERQAVHAEYLASGEQALWDRYVVLRKEAKKLAFSKKMEEQASLEKGLVDSFECNKKRLFSWVNRQLKPRSKAASAVRAEDGSLAATPKAKQEVWAAYCEKLCAVKEDAARFDDAFREKIADEVKAMAVSSLDEPEANHDRPLELAEVAKVRKARKLGKAGGTDGLPNEFVVSGGQVTDAALHAALQWLWEAEQVPETWGVGLIHNIFKDGSPEVCGNYRGITLLNNLAKLFTKLISDRLQVAMEAKLADEQGGFRPKRSCADQAFVLADILTRRRMEGKHSFVFFLDVRKAFDTVWRDGLWWKLYKYGISGKLWRVIRKVYGNIKSGVLVDGEATRLFKSWQGVWQGDSASPTLFGVFINGLAEELRASGLGVEVGVEKLQILLFADDVALIADSPEDLQKMISIVANYTKKWRLEENIKKCAVLEVESPFAETRLFYPKRGKRKRQRISRDTYHFFPGADAIRLQDRYKYLGIWFSDDLSWKLHCRQLSKVVRAKTAALARVLKNRSLPTGLRLHVWKAIFTAKMDYGSEVWEGSSERKMLEADQLLGLRSILHCSSKTSNWAVRGETGVWRAEARQAVRALRFRGKLEVSIDHSRFVHKLFSLNRLTKDRRARKCWQEHNDVLVKDYKLEDALERLKQGEEGAYEEWVREVDKAVERVEGEEFREQCAECSTLKVLGTLKQKPELEEWLKGPLDAATLLKMKFRMGSHALFAFLKKRGICDGLCKVCEEEEEETVEHFLLHCVRYEEERKAISPSLQALSTDAEKVTKVLGSDDKKYLTFLEKAWAARCTRLDEIHAGAEEGEEGGGEMEDGNQPSIRDFFSPVAQLAPALLLIQPALPLSHARAREAAPSSLPPFTHPAAQLPHSPIGGESSSFPLRTQVPLPLVGGVVHGYNANISPS